MRARTSSYSNPNLNRQEKLRSGLYRLPSGVSAVLSVLLLVAVAGCQTSPSGYTPLAAPLAETPKSNVSIVLHEGDTVRVSFPASPELNRVQQIRRDGMVTLPLVGEFKASGLTPVEMQKQITKLYEPQLQNKEVVVAVDSAALSVYVTGAVLRPGRISSDRPMTPLEAVLEAGVDYAKANLKKVSVIRQENGQTEHHTFNLKRVLAGQQSEAFSLKPLDIIYVPERFSWF